MFHIFVWKREAEITSFQLNMISDPVAAPIAPHWRRASAPSIFEDLVQFDDIPAALAHLESVLAEHHAVHEDLVPWPLPGQGDRYSGWCKRPRS